MTHNWKVTSGKPGVFCINCGVSAIDTVLRSKYKVTDVTCYWWSKKWQEDNEGRN